jgi:hypothetical protein
MGKRNRSWASKPLTVGEHLKRYPLKPMQKNVLRWAAEGIIDVERTVRRVPSATGTRELPGYLCTVMTHGVTQQVSSLCQRGYLKWQSRPVPKITLTLRGKEALDILSTI